MQTKQDYLRRLAQKLSALPEHERQDALEYYEGYLSDAEDEQLAITQLGSPGEVAADILADYMARPAATTSYTSFKERKRGAKVAWAFVIGIFALPIGLPLLITAAVLIFALFVTLGALIFSFGVAAVSIVAAGLVSLVVAPFVLIQSFGTGLLALGYGLISLGVGILLFKFCSFLVGGFAVIGRRASAKILRRKTTHGQLYK